jgi:AcrR family transcriptional regulator
MSILRLTPENVNKARMTDRPIASPFKTADAKIREREEKREAVLLAAVQMFNMRGYHATSLDDVAARLGISKPTIYHYLGNKDQVLRECVARGLKELIDGAHQAALAQGSGLDRLRLFLIDYALSNMGDFGRCVIRTGEESLSPQSAASIKETKREIDAMLRAMIQAAMDDGSIAAGDVRLIAFAAAGALNWTARWYDPSGARPAIQEATALVDILCQGLMPRAA